MLIYRLISGISISAFVLLTILVFPNWFFAFITIMLIVVGLYEFFTLVEKKGIPIYKYFGIFIGIMIPLSTYFKFEPTKGWELFFIAAACMCLFLAQFTRRKNTHAIAGISTTLFGIVYVSWFFTFMIKLKFAQDMNPSLNGANLVLFLLLVTKLGDVGSYFIGSLAGKHSLIARISPKKSVEGAIGGLLCSALTAYLSRGLLPGGIPVYHFLILGISLGILAQIGDLSESLIKRDCKVKDSGSVVPGMGGILDIIDSVLFTTPIFYFYMRFLLP
ncbi:MAG: phosphatidate cytidylyltransferase [Candidatus Omnitrophota bacterium]